MIADDRQSGWDLYAYQVFPVGSVNTRQEPFEFPHLQVQPLPADCVHLGYDPVSRPLENEFEHSPLWCNGWCERVKVNRYCLLDDAEEAFRWARKLKGIDLHLCPPDRLLTTQKIRAYPLELIELGQQGN